MRDICGKMPCNSKIISVMEQYHMPEIVSVEQAEKIMLNKTIEQIVEEIGLIGTTYYLTEPCESVLYHSRNLLYRCVVRGAKGNKLLFLHKK